MTSFHLPDGTTVQLTDWIDDRIYNTIAVTPRAAMRARPARTYCHRRWPDVVIYSSGTRDVRNYAAGIWTAATLVDEDLCAVVTAAHRAFEHDDSVENEWALANTLDAAIDEQDRRRGWAPRAPRPPEPPPVLPTFAAGQMFVVPVKAPTKPLPPHTVVYARMFPPPSPPPAPARRWCPTLRQALYAAVTAG